MGTRLIHFSAEPLGAIYDVPQLEKCSRSFKPRGLWVSVEGNGDGWKSWCEDEMFQLPSLAHQTEIILADDAKILRLSSAAEIDAFTQQWRLDDWPTGIGAGRDYVYSIKWPEIAKLYDGIIIAPYCWDRRLDMITTWYYTWDCASGCIWNAKAIAETRALPSELDRTANSANPAGEANANGGQ